jgi:hypothetical protein
VAATESVSAKPRGGPGCQWRWQFHWGEYSCPHPVHDLSPGICIFHAPKDPVAPNAAAVASAFADAFGTLIDRWRADSPPEWDLRGFVFPPDGESPLRDMVPADVVFDEATFSGDARFAGTTFSGDASFEWTRFSGDARFNPTTFSGNAGFFRTTFSRDATFAGMTLNWDANFAGTTFSGDASFDRTTFRGDASFNRTTFSGDASFSQTTFNGDASFRDATVTGTASFYQTTFSRDTSFVGARFNGAANFVTTTFSRDTSFVGARFNGAANFVTTTFSAQASYDWTTFIAAANFDRTTFHESTTFYRMRIGGRVRMVGRCFEGAASFRDVELDKDARVEFIAAPGDENGGALARPNLTSVSFRGTNVESFVFRHVEWAKRADGRVCLHDELVEAGGADGYSETAHNYHQLVLNYEARREYELAEDFHIGEMECRRKQTALAPWAWRQVPALGTALRLVGWLWGWLARGAVWALGKAHNAGLLGWTRRLPVGRLGNLVERFEWAWRWIVGDGRRPAWLNPYEWYSWLSLYGASWRRAGGVLLAMVPVFGTLLFLVGGVVDSSPPLGSTPQVPGWTPTALIQSLWYVLSVPTFGRDRYYEPFGLWAQLVSMLAAFAILGQLALLLFAVRRRFRR